MKRVLALMQQKCHGKNLFLWKKQLQNKCGTEFAKFEK